jgi:uncharacterized protein (DUF885 family)
MTYYILKLAYLMKKLSFSTALCSILLTACSQQAVQNTNAIDQTNTATATQNPVTAAIKEAVKTPTKTMSSEAVNQLFDDTFMQRVMRSPIYQTYLGIKKDYGQWDDLSDEVAHKERMLTQQELATLQDIKPENLDHQTQVSLKLAIQGLQNELAQFKYRMHNYPVNQMYGTHSRVPSLLINQHSINSLSDAEAYISRLNGIDKLFNQLIENLNKRADMGVIAPKFVYPYVISDSENLIKGAPFDSGKPSPLLADFSTKIEKTSLSNQQKKSLIKAARKALNESVKPAYQKLITALQSLEKRADNKDGAWKFPDGEAFYNQALANTTTTKLTAEEIHQIGLNEVDRIHDEMRQIMKKVDYQGDLASFFEFMRTDKQFYYGDNPTDRQRYMTEAKDLIDIMKSRLDELFITKPKADMIIKAVEPFREQSAGKAFYQQPSMDGSRPGIYYANLYQMSDMPTYQMEALAYHEGIPGHHMQIAIAQELKGLPKFRKFGRYTAYTEGWGLYSELVPKEIGLYQDPYSDFGRLAMELWRACRLVVDTGIHSMRWTRQQGIDYYMANTPNPQGDAVKMVERHIVSPSQATAYKIGMLKILELRQKAKSDLGSRFDIREFHDIVLKNGPLPLNILEEFIDLYIQDKQTAT